MIAETILMALLATSVTSTSIDKWYPMPNRTVMLHFEGTPENTYGLYSISQILPCPPELPQPEVKHDQIVLVTGGSTRVYMRYCYIINIGDRIATIEDDGFIDSLEKEWKR